jgi:hypothetical protein
MKYKVISLFVLALLLLSALIHRENNEHERKHVKYYTIHESAEPYRDEIKEAYAEWTERTGIIFKEDYKLYRTVTIYALSMKDSPEERTIGLYYLWQKDLYVFDTSEFYNIFLHEAGHSIGIMHNDDYKDIMYPYSWGFQEITDTCLHDLEEAMSESNYLLFF